MAYDTNPRLPRIRAKACDIIKEGKTVTEIAHCFGFSKGTINKWMKKYTNGSA